MGRRDLSKRDMSIGGHRLSRDGRLRHPMRDYYPSRFILEERVRSRVRALPNVTVLCGHELVGLTSADDRDRVTGAVIADRATEETKTLTADVVVDATGRGSRTPVFLDQLGYGRPREHVLSLRVCYTTQWLQLSRSRLPVDLFGVYPEPNRLTGFALIG